MNPPKIDICIEGYNIEQTDFYIAHIIEKYNSLNELYRKSCEHIVFLEKECKEGFLAALSETESRIINKLESLENRLSDVEKEIGIKVEEVEVVSSEDSAQTDENDERFKAELSDFHSELEDIKSLFLK